MTNPLTLPDLTPGAQALEAGEDIIAEKVSWDQAMQWALDGTIRDAKTLVALLYWNQTRAKR